MSQLKRPFTRLEDQLLTELVYKIQKEDPSPKRLKASWGYIANQMTNRTARQCKERWFTHLSPESIKVPFTAEDDEKLAKLVRELGTSWTKISEQFKNKTPEQCKNRYRKMKRATLRRRSQEMGRGSSFLIRFQQIERLLAEIKEDLEHGPVPPKDVPVDWTLLKSDDDE